MPRLHPVGFNLREQDEKQKAVQRRSEVDKPLELQTGDMFFTLYVQFVYRLGTIM